MYLFKPLRFAFWKSCSCIRSAHTYTKNRGLSHTTKCQVSRTSCPTCVWGDPTYIASTKKFTVGYDVIMAAIGKMNQQKRIL